MQRSNSGSDSDESTAASVPKLHRFRCPRCWRTFSSGQALGGHQNAHRADRVVQRVTNIVGGAHRRKQGAEVRPPPGQIVDESGSNEVNIQEHQHQHQHHDDGVEADVVDGNGSDNRKERAKTTMCVVVDPQEMSSSGGSDAVLTTRDFLGEWMPVYNAGNPQDPILKVSRTPLPTSNKNDHHHLDLDLKLGF